VLKPKVTKEDVKYPFHSLTPIDNVNLGIYESAINFAFSNKSVKNVAMSGSYGSGKSSVLSTYEKNHKNRKFIHISLVHFNSTDKSSELEDLEMSSNIEKNLEGKILNQLIHQIPQEKIPLTNFRIKKTNSTIQNIIISVLAVLSVLIGLLLIFHTQWADFVKTIHTELVQKFLSLSVKPEASFIAGIVLLAISFVFVYKLIKWVTINHMIKKLSVKDLEIEVLGDNKESYFDQYLNDVLYIFKNAKADAIVFEDIDRYESSIIFERLHEINTLVNAEKKTLFNFRKNKIVRFFYLIRDDIFTDKDRVKFFDFIIPIVPVVDSSNSFDKFLEYFKKTNENDLKLDPGFLQGLSLYIDDMRILQNICNEFLIYHKQISTTRQDSNKMLAIIAYKNIFPRDFADLQLRKGFVFEIIGGNGKKRLIASEMSNLEEEIITKSEELKNLQQEMLTEDELSFIYAKKVFQGNINNWHNWDANQCRTQLSNNVYGKQEIVDEYERRLEYAEIDPNSKKKRILILENEINTLKSKKTSLEGLRLSEIINRENIDTFFSETISEKSDSIINSLYFNMIKYLIREGYIDETYEDYMTYFYEKSLTRNDKIFLRSVTDKKAEETSYWIDYPGLVISRIPLPYFNQKETLNYCLFHYLLASYIVNNQYKHKATKLIQQIKENKYYDFIVDFSIFFPELKNMVISFGTEWKSFISDLFDNYGIVLDSEQVEIKSQEFIKRYAYTLFSICDSNEYCDGYFDKLSKSQLIGYVSNDESFLNENEFDSQKLVLGLKHFGVKFVKLNYNTANKELFTLAYNENLYSINFDNIKTLLMVFYNEIDPSCVKNKNYTSIMSYPNSPLVTYINDNINEYIKMYLENCDGVIFDSVDAIMKILNNSQIEKSSRITYIEYLDTKMDDISYIEDTELWGYMLQNTKCINYSCVNIFTYYLLDRQDKFDDILVSYINKEGFVIGFSNLSESNEYIKDFYNALVKSTDISNEIYRDFVSKFDISYETFDIVDMPIDKLTILDQLGKIILAAENLKFIRSNYDDYLVKFIIRHIQDYIQIVSDSSIYVFSEVLKLLNESISDELKIELIELDKNKTQISVKEKQYSDELCSYILTHRFVISELNYISDNYDKFGIKSKKAILNLAISNLDTLKNRLDKVSRSLFTAMFEFQDLSIDKREQLFLTLATNASEAEIKIWLPLIGRKEFLWLYQKKTKNKSFDKTDFNKKLLEILKTRKLIENYELDDNEKYIVHRKKGIFEKILQ
jgi:hypothetical protein